MKIIFEESDLIELILKETEIRTGRKAVEEDVSFCMDEDENPTFEVTIPDKSAGAVLEYVEKQR